MSRARSIDGAASSSVSSRLALVAGTAVVAILAGGSALAPEAAGGSSQQESGPAGTAPEPGTRKTAPEAPIGWRDLFDGRTLEGWKVFTPGAASGSATFLAADGVLTCTGTPTGYIATTEEFESFELELQWRFDPEKGPGNSGVLLRVEDRDQVWPRSIEAQLHSGHAGDVWNIGEVPMKTDDSRREGRRTRKAHESSERPIGQWNRYRIVLDGGTLELWVNGVLQNEARECEIRRGRIALQSEGAFIQFRGIRLRPLGESPAP